jgi:competence protein ComEC
MPTILSDTLSSVLRRPLCCLAVVWAGGIILAASLAIPGVAWLLAGGVLGLAWILTARLPGVVPQLAFTLAFLCLAAGVCSPSFSPRAPDDPRYLPPGGVTLIGYTLTPPIATDYGWHTPFRLYARRVGQTWRSARGTVYLSGDGQGPRPSHYYQVDGTVIVEQPPGDPYQFDWRPYLADHDLSYRVRGVGCRPLAQPSPTAWATTFRALCRQRLAETLPAGYQQIYAQLLDSMLFGVSASSLPVQITEQFRRAGDIHLLIVSGSQVVLLASLLLVPLWLLPNGRARFSYPRLRAGLLLLSLPLLGFYLALADSGPSAERALLIALLIALSIFLALSPLAARRSYIPDRLTLLAAAALILLIGQPHWLFDPGMQLSFAAVFGLITLVPVFMRIWRRWPRVLAWALAATCAAQLMTFPILAWHFGIIPLLAPVTHLIVVPLVVVLLPLGLLTILCALLAPGVAILLNQLNYPLLHLLLLTNAAAADCAWGQLPCYTRSLWAVGVYYLAVWGLVRLLSKWLDSKCGEWEVPAGSEPRLW